MKQITSYHFKQFNNEDLYHLVSSYTERHLNKLGPMNYVALHVQRPVEIIDIIGLSIGYAMDDKIAWYPL